MLVNEKMLIPEVCPSHAVSRSQVDRRICEACKDRPCLHKNRNLGLRWSCQSYRVGELVAEAVGMKAFHFSGGGVTITGGEATLQFEALALLLEQLHERDVNVALETNGTHPRLGDLFSYADELMIDLKHCDPQRHREVVGHDNGMILKNIEKAAARHPNLTVRIPLIPDFNDQPEAVGEAIRFLKTLDQDHLSVEFLAYHDFGKVKWGQCGMPYRMADKKINPKSIAAYKKQAADQGLRVKTS